jgi:hypothetical protein
MSLHKFQTVDATGEVIGGFSVQPAGINLHGWLFSNSSVTNYQVDFYVPNAPGGVGNTNVTVPAATGANTRIFSVQVPANSSKEFFADKGIYLKDGVFAKTTNASLTGGVIYQ